LQAFLKKQFLRESPYNVYLWYLAPYAFSIRHAVTGLFVAGLLGGVLFSFWWPPGIWIPAVILGVYLFLAVIAAAQQAVHYKRWRHLVVLPLAFLAFHAVHGMGMWAAVIRLLANRAPVQQGRAPWPGAAYFRWSPPRPENSPSCDPSTNEK
jgi:hypothetical protein